MEQGLDTSEQTQLPSANDSESSVETSSDETRMEDISNLNDTIDETLVTSPSNNIDDTSSNKEEEKESTHETKIAPPIAKVFKTFQQRFEELKSFKAQYGHCRVPSKFENNPSLAAWCANLKQSYRLLQQGRKPILKLTEEKVTSLEQLGFEWKYSGRTPKQASSKKASLQHPIAMPHNDDNKENIKVGSLTSDNFEKEKIEKILDESDVNEKNTLSADQVDSQNTSTLKRKIEVTEIEEIQESVAKKTLRRERMKSKTFHERLQELKEYKAKFGHCQVSRNDKNHYSLGSWCHNIRGSFRANQKLLNGDDPILSQEKISALNEIGFDWNLKEPRQMKSFEQRLEDLKEFKALFGHTRVPSGYEKNPSLAYWCNNLRNAYKMKKTGKKQYISLSQDRIDALSAIDFEFGKKYQRPTTIKPPIENVKITNIGIVKNGSSEKVKVTKEENRNGLMELEGGVGPILFV